MARDVFIGLDVGTTRCKALAIDVAGAILHAHALQLTTIDGEQDPDDVWLIAAKVLTRLTAQIQPERIAALALSGAMHTLLPASKQGRPLARASTWQDQRAVEINDGLRPQIDLHGHYQRTGCPWLPHYHVPRLRWMRHYQCDGFEQADYLVSLKDFLLYQLTEQWATDIGMASSSGLLDIHRLTWDEHALLLATIAPRVLPPLVQPRDVVGTLTARVAKRTGLPKDIPVVAGTTDGGLANFGSGAAHVHDTAISVGTSAAVRTVASQPQFDEKGRTWCYVLDADRYLAGCALNNGGSALEHMRQELYPDLDVQAGYEAFFADAATVPPGSDGLLIVPFFMPERGTPWSPHTPPIIDGLADRHTAAHQARATLEGLACSIALAHDLIAAPRNDRPLRITGSLAQHGIWRQIIADVTNRSVMETCAEDASVVGAALLARIGAGEATVDDVPACHRQTQRVDPIPANAEIYARSRHHFAALVARTIL